MLPIYMKVNSKQEKQNTWIKNAVYKFVLGNKQCMMFTFQTKEIFEFT